MSYDASDRRHIKIAERAAKAADNENKAVVTSIMSLPGSRAWMLSILERCHCFGSSFTPNALNTAFAEGERNIGLQLLNDIMRYCPEKYVDMMRERNEREVTAEVRRAPAETEPGDD